MCTAKCASFPLEFQKKKLPTKIQISILSLLSFIFYFCDLITEKMLILYIEQKKTKDKN